MTSMREVTSGSECPRSWSRASFHVGMARGYLRLVFLLFWFVFSASPGQEEPEGLRDTSSSAPPRHAHLVTHSFVTLSLIWGGRHRAGIQ